MQACLLSHILLHFVRRLLLRRELGGKEVDSDSLDVLQLPRLRAILRHFLIVFGHH